MSEDLSIRERRALIDDITNHINAWARRTFGDANAAKNTNYVRALARNAVCKKNDRLLPFCKSHEEAKATMEAAQDIMDVVDSIRWKTEHGGE